MLKYNVLVAAKGQNRAITHKTLQLCTIIPGEATLMPPLPLCSAFFPCPSTGGVMESEELFLEAEEANSLLTKDSMILELKLLDHQHHWEEDSEGSRASSED